MARIPFILTFAFAATAFSGCLLDDPSDLTLEGPRWESGYSYAYATRGSVDFQGQMNGRFEDASEDIPAIHTSMEVLSTQYKSGKEPVYLLGVSQSIPGAYDATSEEFVPNMPRFAAQLSAVRQRDLQYVPASYSSEAKCDEEDCQVSLSSIEVGMGPAWTYFDFPLQEGKTWGGGLDRAPELAQVLDNEGPDASDIDWDFEAEVVGPATVSLPVGDVQAMQVEFFFTPHDLAGWMESVREEAADEGATLDHFDYSISLRETAYYSEAYRAVVLDEYVGSSYLSASGRGEGESFDVSVSINVEFTSELQGAELVPKPERSLSYIAKVLTGDLPLRDPTGTVQRPAGYSIDLVSDKTLVNAAVPEAIAFSVGLIDADALPAGHQAAWRVTDGLSEVVKSGEGLDFSHTFDKPGVYGVEVLTTDENGAVTAADGLTLVANYESTFLVNCGPLATPVLLRGCRATELEVPVGLQSLAITVRPTSPTSAVNYGYLYVQDPDGQRVESSDGQAEYTVRIDDLTGYAVDGRPWTYQWVQQLAVLEDAEVSISLIYEEPVSAEPAEEAGNGTGLARILERTMGPLSGPPGPWASGVPDLRLADGLAARLMP